MRWIQVWFKNLIVRTASKQRRNRNPLRIRKFPYDYDYDAYDLVWTVQFNVIGSGVPGIGKKSVSLISSLTSAGNGKIFKSDKYGHFWTFCQFWRWISNKLNKGLKYVLLDDLSVICLRFVLCRKRQDERLHIREMGRFSKPHVLLNCFFANLMLTR